MLYKVNGRLKKGVKNCLLPSGVRYRVTTDYNGLEILFA
jgi:hypothetical protein